MRLTFRRKLNAFAGVAALAVALLFVTSAFSGERVERSMATIQERYIPKIELQPQLESQLERITRRYQDAVAARDAESLASVHDLESAFLETLAAVGDAVDREEANALRLALDDYCAAADDVSGRLIAQESGEELGTAIAAMQKKQARARQALRTATDFDRHELTNAFGFASKAMADARAYGLWISVALMAIVALLSFVISRNVIASLASINAGLRRFGSGSFGRPIVVTSTDELADVATGANQMAKDLARARTELEKANDELESKVEERTSQLVTANEDLRRSEENLERRVEERTSQVQLANRELEAFSYAVAHDLRAPLRGVSGFAEVLLADCAARLDDEGKDCLHEICDNAKRMAELIDALLSLSRVSRAELRASDVDLGAVARSVVRELAAGHPHGPCELVVAENAHADMDPRLARAMLENLLGNAWKFTSKVHSPRIEFGVRDVEGQQAFFVSDNGAGFDDAYASKLFAPFQRLHTNAEFPGTGIGLATVQRIVHRHGGRVWAEGHVGAGATFLFTIPNRAQEATS
jgi:signal transduction histidine kinase